MIGIGYYYFNEKINYLHLLSVLLGSISIILLFFASNKK